MSQTQISPASDQPVPAGEPAATDAFIDCVGRKSWLARVNAIMQRSAAGRSGRAVQQRHSIELMIERLRRSPSRAPSVTETRIAAIAANLAAEMDRLTPAGRERLRTELGRALAGDATLVPLFHLFASLAQQRGRDFTADLAGLDDGAPFDLLLSRGGVEAELVCDVLSAESGRGVHRSAWCTLADQMDPDLQTWLAAHPGRYLLKMTLPQGLDAADPNALGQLHGRIRTMLDDQRRADQTESAVLRLDPLLVAAAQASELGLLSSLRRQFGPEAHLSVTGAGEALFVMAARAGQENDVPAAVRRRLSALAPTRLTGSRPGILAMFVDDTDRLEWRGLREQLQLEREARLFLTSPEARPVVAVTCTSRLEMFGFAPPDAAVAGEMRFRSPSHPAAKSAELAPAVLSSF